MLLLRANRRAAGLTSLPHSDQPHTSGGLPICMLDELIMQFARKEAPTNEQAVSIPTVKGTLGDEL